MNSINIIVEREGQSILYTLRDELYRSSFFLKRLNTYESEGRLVGGQNLENTYFYYHNSHGRSSRGK